MHEVTSTFNSTVASDELRAVCDVLAKEISACLPEATLKLWYKIPVWFIQDSPIVGYSITKHKGVNLLFWSGQAFDEPGLTPEGSFKAAEIKYMQPSDVDIQQLHSWLAESQNKIYDYKDIRKNRGKLTLL